MTRSLDWRPDGGESRATSSAGAERAVDVGSECHPYCHKSYDAMRITVQVPDDLEAELKERTNDVSAYVLDALGEKLRKEKRDEVRQELLHFAGTGIDDGIYEINQKERREKGRSFSTE